MNKEKSDDLFNRYMEAGTSIEEEKELFMTKNQLSGTEVWFSFVNQKKKKAPLNLHESIRRAIQARQQRQQRFLTGFLGMVASVVLCMVILNFSASLRQAENDRKETLLKEVLSMFPADKPESTEQGIIYEDDMIVIYLVANGL